ncbi:beta-glucosidase H [Fictibacillus fluitans]|uniref:Glycoside hydrolase family 3 C-terminal domain-containing protein n=1 Tax=Fictibacillus fluitans TaxID=3058422 RepID=A0ABT8HYF0_9BACL|nr:glycoside hydrolase family 3 C-terminal domain-containing protein [Fictibacillus sp. NE201]MDN4525808.1 glycoside hydrolase family 3 C-terminal domain-containing protein [Fictibacillus sp. NE201]
MRTNKKPVIRLAALVMGLSIIATPLKSVSAEETSIQPWMNASQPAEKRTDELLHAMTLEDKVSFITGNLNNYYGFYNSGLDRLNIPALTMADGPAGVRIANPDVQDKKSTALPAPIALASTWDKTTAKAYGDLIGNEAFNTTHNVSLGPGLDIARVPWGERNFESLGEDPLLQSQMGVPFVQGIQSYPVLATAKHWLLNNQETKRFTIDSIASERAIQEVYARPFAETMDKADLASVMCSFNKVNGDYACENDTLLNDILKKQLGFKGFVMSDYGANPSTAKSANAGLDLETPGEPNAKWGDKLLTAVKNGEVSQERIDDMARRILTQMFDKGLFDRLAQNNQIPAQAHGKTAREIAEESMVLLKNNKKTLPLSNKKQQSIAVIGPDADNASAAGGGSSLVSPTYTVSPLEGIKNRAGKNSKVTYEPGTDPITAGGILPGPAAVPSSVLTPQQEENSNGLTAEYFNNTNFEGKPVLTRTDGQVNMNLGFYNYEGFNASSPKVEQVPRDLNKKMSARWTGHISAPKTGEYKLSLTGKGEGKLYVDNKLMIDYNDTELGTKTASIQLAKGEKHEVKVEYSTGEPDPSIRDFGAMFRFGWEAPSDAIDAKMQKAIDLAKKSKVAVVVTRTYDSEGYVERSDMELPNDQSKLIREVSKVNPNTIVVNMSGRAVKMTQWKDSVPAIVQAWFGGQEQGNAVANVLFGDVNPSGKLPVTFPVDEKSTPISDSKQFPGQNGTSEYNDDVFVGYKGYEKSGLKVAYPFGHGLSYTSFKYSNLHTNTSHHNKKVTVQLNLRNTGHKKGEEVVQVYTGKLPTNKVDTPAKQLAGFAKIELKPGKQQRVSVDLDPKALSYWDEESNKWVMPSGNVPVYVGSSSQDMKLKGSVNIK